MRPHRLPTSLHPLWNWRSSGVWKGWCLPAFLWAVAALLLLPAAGTAQWGIYPYGYGYYPGYYPYGFGYYPGFYNPYPGGRITLSINPRNNQSSAQPGTTTSSTPAAPPQMSIRDLSPSQQTGESSAAQPSQNSSPPGEVAQVEVRVPRGAELWFEGVKTTQTGEVAPFRSPPLAADRDYVYDIRAKWRDHAGDITEARQITVHAGSRLTVNFATPSEPQTVPAPRASKP